MGAGLRARRPPTRRRIEAAKSLGPWSCSKEQKSWRDSGDFRPGVKTRFAAARFRIHLDKTALRRNDLAAHACTVALHPPAIVEQLSHGRRRFRRGNPGAYLHLDPAQVLRLVERGKLPGRKVGGQWRFAPAVVHHWLEERIGLSSDDELERMEGVLRHAAGEPAEPAISIADMLPLAAVAVPLAARTRGSVITSMVEVAANTGWLWDRPKWPKRCAAREDMLPTALENGVALLHPRRPLPAILDRPFLAFGRTSRGSPSARRAGH